MAADVGFMEVTGPHDTRAGTERRPYLAAVPEHAEPDSMLYWLTRVCREKRELAGRLQVHVAASLSRNQSTIDRFEEGIAWPRNPDATVRAYADDLSVTAIELWQEALRRWSAHLASEAASEAAAAAASTPRSEGADASASRRRARRRA